MIATYKCTEKRPHLRWLSNTGISDLFYRY